MQAREVKKLYYSIGEISEKTGLKQYVLRYWETEFSFLNPKKNSAGNRTYIDKDIEIINEIKSLLYERKFTIKGANQFLTDKYSQEEKVDNIITILDKNSNNDRELLFNLKKGLQDIIDLIENRSKL